MEFIKEREGSELKLDGEIFQFIFNDLVGDRRRSPRADSERVNKQRIHGAGGSPLDFGDSSGTHEILNLIILTVNVGIGPGVFSLEGSPWNVGSSSVIEIREDPEGAVTEQVQIDSQEANIQEVLDTDGHNEGESGRELVRGGVGDELNIRVGIIVLTKLGNSK